MATMSIMSHFVFEIGDKHLLFNFRIIGLNHITCVVLPKIFKLNLIMRKHSHKSRMWDILQEKCLNSSKRKPMS